MVADVARPGIDDRGESLLLAAEEGADRLLESGLVAGHRGQESVGGLLRATQFVAILGALPRLVDELPQGHRRAARLRREPLPVPRQQGDLPGDDAELRTSGTARLR